jgi:hypothetical protein
LEIIQDKKIRKTTKKFSVLIAYRKLKFDKNCKIFNLFSSFEFDENFFNVHFFDMSTCFYLLSAQNLFSRYKTTYSSFSSFINNFWSMDILLYWYWSLRSVFGLLRLIFAFLIIKRILNLNAYKISVQLMYHMTIQVVEPKSSDWALRVSSSL